jgi:cold shock CspA family protein
VHEAPPHGVIASLVPEHDHGFIAAADGSEIYFHRNSVAGGKFDDLEVGQEVPFAEGTGDKGPQATFVRPVEQIDGCGPLATEPGAAPEG